jgi:hypothetical protein
MRWQCVTRLALATWFNGRQVATKLAFRRISWANIRMQFSGSIRSQNAETKKRENIMNLINPTNRERWLGGWTAQDR